MTYDGTILARAREKLDARREKNRQEHQRRVALAFTLRPEIRTCDEKIRAGMTEITRLAFGRTEDSAGRIRALQEETAALRQRRRELIASLGHGEDWLDEIVSCKKCGDSGVFEGGVCECLKKLYNAEMTADLGVLMKNGDECFERFDLTYYDTVPQSGSPYVPRDIMERVLNAAKDFVRDFASEEKNLLLQGGPGLGKTYLSACIARAVAEQGFSVCYDTASSVIGSFELQKFSRDEEADRRVKRMLACDLLILDDLGTEMATPFADSALYTLINTRLNEKKKTVISTNLSYEELEKRYGGPIYSRLAGEYKRMPFIGRDIRQIKKEKVR